MSVYQNVCIDLIHSLLNFGEDMCYQTRMPFNKLHVKNSVKLIYAEVSHRLTSTVTDRQKDMSWACLKNDYIWSILP